VAANQGGVHEARDKELAKATVEGRAFVVSLHSSMTKSAEQARAFGKTLLLVQQQQQQQQQWQQQQAR
jgi:hypothetical protein